MATRKFCDCCNRDITKGKQWDLSIYDEVFEQETFKLDLCFECKDVMKRAITEAKKKLR